MTKLTKKERDVIVYAIRYASKRHTGALSDCTEVLEKYIDSMEDWELQQLIEESQQVVLDCELLSRRGCYDLIIQDNLKLQAVCLKELERRA